MGELYLNGKRYVGDNISVRNNKIFIDGKDVTDAELPSTILEISVSGTLARLDTDASVSCEDVSGDVTAAGSVNCDKVGGNVQAGGSVNCDDVGGSVTAGGSVNRG